MLRKPLFSTVRSSLRALKDPPLTLGISPPGAPTIGTATAGNAQATVSWTAPASSGSAAIAGYRITASTGQTATVGNVTSGTITGLTNGVAATLTVAAYNGVYGPESAASNSVTPAALGIANGTFDTADGWTLGTGWSISGGKLHASAATTNAEIAMAGLEADKLYRVRLTVDSRTAGSLNVALVGNVTCLSPKSGVTDTGTIDFLIYTESSVSAGASPRLQLQGAGGGYSAVLDNVAVTADVVVGAEFFTDPGFDNAAAWSVGTGWSISGSRATGTATDGFVSETKAATVGSFYLWELVVDSYTGGSVRGYQNGTTHDTGWRSAVGTYKRLTYVSGTGSGGGLAGSTFTGSVSSLSLKSLS